MRAPLPPFLLGAPLATAPRAQSLKQVLLPAVGGATVDEFGADVCALSDVDGDGVDDFAVLATRAPYEDPAVRVFSGADRRILLSLELGTLPATDTIRIADAGDVDGDGVPELIVGQPFYPSASVRNGIVRVFSLRTGSIVRTHTGSRRSFASAPPKTSAPSAGPAWSTPCTQGYSTKSPGAGRSGTWPWTGLWS